MVKRIVNFFRKRYIYYKGGETFINYLRNQGIKIGKNTTVGENVSSIQIDCSRPYLIEIGENCRLNTGFVLMTHDFTTMVFKNLYGDFIPSSGKVTIGNNVYFGRQCTVLKGVTIGDNCIIGYGSLVTKDIPANSVAIGRPAKVISTLEEYYVKRKSESLKEAFLLAHHIQDRLGRRPIASDFREEFVFFVDGDKIDDYPDIPIRKQLTKTGDCLEKWSKEHKATFASFEEFLIAAGL